MDLRKITAKGVSLHEIVFKPARARRSVEEILADINQVFEYLPSPAIEEVAKVCACTGDEVRAAAYRKRIPILESRARRKAKVCYVTVCRGQPCRDSGAQAILQAVRETLGIGPGEATPDGKLRVEYAECLDRCQEGPALAIDLKTYAKVSPADVRRLLGLLRPPRAAGDGDREPCQGSHG